MNFTLSASNNLPTGSTVKVFARSLFPAIPLVPQGAPPGSGEAFSGTMGASSLAVTGLAASTAYVATTSVSGTDRYVQFRTAASVVGSIPTRTPTLTAQAYTTVAADHDHVLSVTAGATTATVTLLAAATAGDGATLSILKADTGVGRVAVSNATTEIASLVAQYDIVQLRSNGTSWEVIGGRTAARDTTYGQLGMYCTPGGQPPNAAGGTAVAQRLFLTRFVPTRKIHVVSFSIAVSTAATNNDAVAVGVYSADLQTLLGDAAAATGKLNATGGKVITARAPFDLYPGVVYYGAVLTQFAGGTAAILASATLASALFTDMFTTDGATATAGVSERLTKSTAGTGDLPSSVASPVSTSTGSNPIIAVREF